MLNILKKAALEAGEIQKNYFRSTELDVTHKTDHQNIVTKADKESQDVIERVILTEMEKKGISAHDVGFIGEEDLSSDGRHLFIMDPIDGTSSFASGIDYFCCAIAYVKDGELLAGCINRPITGEMYCAEKGKGATVTSNGKTSPLQIADVDTKDLMIYTEVWKSFEEAHIKIIEKLMPEYRSVHINGAIALDIVAVAENIAGLSMVDIGPWIWDLAAAKLIIEEAGGGLYDWKGNELTLDFSTRNKQYPVLACHPNKLASVMKYMQTY